MANKENLSAFPKSPSPRCDRNLSVPTSAESECTPPGHPSTPIGRRHRQNLSYSSPTSTPRPISPSARNHILKDQRDHSACANGTRALPHSQGSASPLRVRKTRENLRVGLTISDTSSTHTVPVPVPTCACISHHPVNHDESAEQVVNLSGFSEDTTVINPEGVQSQAHSQSILQRHKSASRRMLSRVKSSVVGVSRSQQIFRPTDGVVEADGLLRRLSSRRKHSVELRGTLNTGSTDCEPARDSVDSAIQPYTEGDECIDVNRDREEVSARSCTGSTLSSSGVLSLSPTARRSESVTPDMTSSTSSSPELEPTPRARRSPSHSIICQASLLYVDVLVRSDRIAVDAAEEKDIWVAVVATVRTNSFTFPPGNDRPRRVIGSWPIGTITSLRLCFKPAGDCRVLDVVGQKSLKDLVEGTTCSLFVKVRLYPVDSAKLSGDGLESDQDSLFAELESMVGMVESNLLHVEARYRQSLLPPNNVITIRNLIKVRRPKAGSRWSQVEDSVESLGTCWVHEQLVAYLRDNYSSERAKRLIERALGQRMNHGEAAQIKEELTAQVIRNTESTLDRQLLQPVSEKANRPTVVVTDIDSVALNLAAAQNTSHHSPTATYTLPQETHVLPESSRVTDGEDNAAPRTTSRDAESSPSARLTPVTNTKARSDCEEDSARALWRHIRRSSLSAEAQLADVSSERLGITDAVIVERQKKAIANKRSVGAETLMAWKWEGSAVGETAVAPWL